MSILEINSKGIGRWHNKHTEEMKNSPYKVFVDELTVCRWIDYLVNNQYLMVGEDVLVKQIIGIPMGTNCAVFLANLYLFGYELDFVTRGASDIAHHPMLKRFRRTRRFIDDLIAIDNPYFVKYRYTSYVDETGLKGIYPVCLTLNKECSSFMGCDYLDVHLSRKDGVGAIQTEVYDKRDRPPLVGLGYKKYTHMTSFLSHRSKYGTMLGQQTRFLRLCSQKHTFVWWTRRLIDDMLGREYDKRILKRFCKRFVTNHGYMYGLRGGSKFVKQFVNHIFSTKNATPLPPYITRENS